jgi:tellurite resistance protein TerC
VYTSNIFAILGLRSLYFLLANFLGRFRYLNMGLAVILTFVGLKMIAEELFGQQLQAWGIGQTQRILISLGFVIVTLAVAVLASIWAGPKEPLEHPPEAVSEMPPANPQSIE